MDDLQAILNTVPANATGQEDLNQDGNEKCLTLCFEITKWLTLLKRSKMSLQRGCRNGNHIPKYRFRSISVITLAATNFSSNVFQTEDQTANANAFEMIVLLAAT